MKRTLGIGPRPGIVANYLWDLEIVIPSMCFFICKMRKVDLLLAEALCGHVSNDPLSDNSK